MLPPDFSSNKNIRTGKSAQVFPLAALTAAWCLFVLSAQNYKGFHWYPWLIGSRVALVSIGLGLLGASLFRKIQNRNTIFWFFLISMAVQASHGALEPSGQADFYNFTGVIFLATNLIFNGTFRSWIRRYAPIQLIIMALPLFFKDRSLLYPLGNFVDHFSLPVAGVIIGSIVARINSVKYQALLDVIRLQEEVLTEKKKSLDFERAMRASLETELDIAKKEIQKESKVKALGEIAAQVAHDVRSPLAALDMVVKEVGSSFPEDMRVMIRMAIGRIQDIANNLIEKNREQLVRGQNQEEFGVQLLSSLIDSLISEKRMQFRSKIGVEIENKLTAESYGLFAKIQPVEFKRLLSNLINNAVEACSDRGKITISLSGHSETVAVYVQDDGKGIPSEILANLMNRGETYDKEGGSGLGLYHARKSLEEIGGSLRLESTIGKGTRAIISLPRQKHPEWFVEKINLTEGIQIVVLDDDQTVHQIWRGRFESLRLYDQEIQLHHFSTPRDLIDWQESSDRSVSPVLYLVDYELLGQLETGLDVIEKLGIHAQSILVTSRYEEPTVRDRCSSLKLRLIPKGMAGFVSIELSTDPGKTRMEKLDAVLIDDDHLVRMTWERAAEIQVKRFRAFSSPAEFLNLVSEFDLTTPIYVDSNLGDGVKGEEFARVIRQRGFTELYLATGYERNQFPKMPWLRGIVGKNPPWMGVSVS